MKPAPWYLKSTAAFFGLSYLLSWSIWIPLALSHFGIGPFHIPEGVSELVRLFGVLMPAAAALLLTAFCVGRSAVKKLLQPLKTWRVGWGWWAAAVFVYPALLGITALIYNRLGWGPSLEPVQAGGATLVINIVILAVAALGEEIGWRGLALPSLQQRYSPLGASAILGILWATWHLPFWLLLDTFDQYGAGYLALNYLFVLPMTFYITWFYNRSRGSLSLVVAFHLSFNIVNVAVFPVTPTIEAFALFVGIAWITILPIFPRLRSAPTLRPYQDLL